KITKEEVNHAVDKATDEQNLFKMEIQAAGERALKEIKERNMKGDCVMWKTISYRPRNKSWNARAYKFIRYGSAY
ncbi:hypothetical protein BM533_09495, partial [Clostridioides difficile]